MKRLLCLLVAALPALGQYYIEQLPVTSSAGTNDLFVLSRSGHYYKLDAGHLLTSASIGVTIQGYDSDLTTLGAGGSAARSFLGLAIGSNVQAYSLDLDLISGNTTGASRTLLTKSTTNSILSYIGGQPLDDDLTALAAVNTDGFGRALLSKSDGSSVVTYIGAQPLNSDLTAISTSGTTSASRTLLTKSTTNSILSYIGGQPLDDDLTALAAVNTDGFGRALLSKSSGSSVLTYISGQPLNAELTAIGALSTDSFGRGLLTKTSGAAVLSYIGSPTVTLTGDVTGSGAGSFATTLASTAVTPGSYTAANLTVDAKGRITAASNGSSAGVATVTSYVVLDGSVGYTGLSSPGFTNGGVVISSTAHGLTTGEVLWFQNSAKGPIADTAYYVTVVDADNFKVSDSQAHRVAAQFITATADGVCLARHWNSNPIIASSNVDGVIRPWSLTAGAYVVDFTTAASDAYYVVSGQAENVSDSTPLFLSGGSVRATTGAYMVTVSDTSSLLTDTARLRLQTVR